MLTPGKIYIGSSVRLTAHIYDLNDTDQDPSTVTCEVMDPRGTVTTYTYGTDAAMSQSSVGDYYLDLNPDQSGTWFFRWKGADSVSNYVVVEEGQFRVQYSPVADRYLGGDYV